MLRAHDAIAIRNIRAVLPEGILENCAVMISDGQIKRITDGPTGSALFNIDGQNGLLMPGMVDLHGDALEAAIAPRPAAPFSVQNVLPSYDTTLATNGITTMYHCVAVAQLGSLTKPLRHRETALEIINAIHAYRPRAQIRTKIHLRYEILDTGSLSMVEELIRGRRVDLISFMDHTPGFGVFPDVDAYRRYIQRSGGSLTMADDVVAQRLKMREHIDFQALNGLVTLCHRHHIPVASHDDHTVAKIDQAVQMGITIAEFPVTMEAVRTARKKGMKTVFGAANLVRGVSHAGNLKASDMVVQDMADIIVSDYAPMSLLQGLFKANQLSRRPLHELVPLFTRNPSKAVNDSTGTGEIVPGQKADLILLHHDTRYPRVIATFVGGTPVYLGSGLKYQ
jgi:alpha-D-ribose 1-methylphosphonate 5-triphosphate diphosphatase